MAHDAPAGMPRGETCPTCRLTRWEAKQVDGWVSELTRERDEARAENARLREALTYCVIDCCGYVNSSGAVLDSNGLPTAPDPCCDACTQALAALAPKESPDA